MRLFARLGGWCASLVPAALAGAFFLLAISRLTVPSPPDNRFQSLLFGALYGIGVAGLVRLFRVAPWGKAVAGFVCGPVPFALLAGSRTPQADREGAWLLAAILGLMIGLLEAARLQREQRSGGDPVDA